MMNKFISIACLFLVVAFHGRAQNVGIGTTTPAASAKLDINSTNSGLLIPRVSLNDVTDGLSPVAAPETGVLVFNNNASVTGGSGIGFYYWDGSIWARLEDTNFSGGGGSGWQLNGNAGTNPMNNFVGTIDAQDLVFRTDNVEKMRVKTNGNVGIGIDNPASLFHIQGGNNDVMRVASSNQETDIRYVSPSGNWQAGTNNAGNGTNNNHFYIYDNAYRLTVQAGTGRVGINTRNPASLFHVQGTNNDVMRIASSNQETDIHYISPSGTWQVGTNNAGFGTNGNHFYIYDNAYRLTVQAGTGRVGIGSQFPSAKLHLINNAAGNAFQVNSPGTGATGWGVYINGGGGAFAGNSLMELRGGTPYIDFSNTSIEDYDIRFIRDQDNRLRMDGGQLYVTGFRNEDYGNVGTFIENFIGVGDVSFASGTRSFSIRAEQWVIGSTFACYSDRRIKKDFRLADNKHSLALLSKIKVKHYKHIDHVQNGGEERIGFIAQEVEEVFPEAIATLTNTIPNIYKMADNATYNKENSTLSVSVGTSVTLKEGDQIQLFINDEINPRTVSIASASGGSFIIKNWDTEVEQVFVYGTEVKDFKGVDYDRIFILGISAIQELDKKVGELKDIKKELYELRQAVELLKASTQK